jgi:hypothetical protein
MPENEPPVPEEAATPVEPPPQVEATERQPKSLEPVNRFTGNAVVALFIGGTGTAVALVSAAAAEISHLSGANKLAQHFGETSYVSGIGSLATFAIGGIYLFLSRTQDKK